MQVVVVHAEAPSHLKKATFFFLGIGAADRKDLPCRGCLGFS